MKGLEQEINIFILNLIIKINKHKHCELELNTKTLNYIESKLTAYTLSSDLTSPIRKDKTTTTLFGRAVSINEKVKDNQIHTVPNKTIIYI